MPVTIAVLLAGLCAAIVIWMLSRIGPRVSTIDPAAEERWLVAWMGRHPRWGRRFTALDHRVAGGMLAVASLFVVFMTALIVGVIFDMVDRESGFASWDRAVADWGSEHATGWSTEMLSELTQLGGTPVVVALAVIVFIVDHRRHRNPDVAIFLAAVLVGASLVNNALKWIVDRERPAVNHLVGASGASFPSGHSAMATAAWCAFALVVTRARSRRAQASAAGLAALVAGTVAASRALLGVHWLTDVLAGVAVGWGWFLLCALAFGGRLQRLGEPAERVDDRDAANRPNAAPVRRPVCR